MLQQTQESCRQSRFDVADAGSLKDEIKQLVQWAKANGSVDRYSAKRRAPRFAAATHMTLASDPKQRDRFRHVSLHNISEGGFACWSRQEFETRATVFIRADFENGPGPWLPATVTHCTHGLRGFLIGASFDS